MSTSLSLQEFVAAGVEYLSVLEAFFVKEDPQSVENLSKSLVVCLHANKLLTATKHSFLDVVSKWSIRSLLTSCESSEILFRGDQLPNKILNNYCRILGKPWIANSLVSIVPSLKKI